MGDVHECSNSKGDRAWDPYLVRVHEDSDTEPGCFAQGEVQDSPCSEFATHQAVNRRYRRPA